MKNNEEVAIYTAGISKRSILTHLHDIIMDLPDSHELGARLFKRNLKALYRQSLLGFSWAILQPLATAALWIFLRSNNVVNIENGGVSYPIFVLTGTILWQIFTEAISAPINHVTENKAMLSKINIPRDGLLLAGIYEVFFNILIKILMLTFLYVYFHQAIKISSLLLAPLGIFALCLAGFSVGVVLIPVGMLFKDINRGLAMLLPFLMYLTPVVYPAPHEGSISLIMKWNPLATLITQTRNWLTAQPVYDMPVFWLFTLAFTLLFLLALVMYRLSMPIIIERIGA